MCSKGGCGTAARFTMTYVHADACVVIGPLATRAEPGAHDLCARHAERLSAPVGWQLLRLDVPDAVPERSRDDLLAIADAVREAARPRPRAEAPPTSRRRGHLSIVTGEDSP